MKPMKTTLLALAGVLLLAGSVGRTEGQTAPPDGKGTMMTSMPMSMQSDTKLDQLVADLNGSRGASVDARLDKVIAVVNELVAERKQMRGMMRMMHGDGAPKDDHSTHHPAPGK
jgi:hypothetical protein